MTNILTVCSANICRSPLAEYVLRAKLAPLNIPVTVSSAGVSAMQGAKMEPAARDLATRWGATDTDKHASRAVTKSLIRRADLILTATGGHAIAIAHAVPEAASKTFAIRLFAQAVANADDLTRQLRSRSTGDERFRALIEQINEARPKGPDDFDVPDPFGGDATYYERAQALMLPGINATVDVVRAAWAGAKTVA